jgi:RNA polymerase sigma factor (sigma-70 family)
MGVCRRILNHTQDAEDAFQATFLVLARKAGSIRKKESLGSWLYGVAYHLAVAAREQSARRRTHEREAHAMSQPDAGAEAVWPELQPVLDEELHRLPDKYRRPLVLCYLQGKSNRQAAAELGWPVGSISRRLARGKELLRQNLTRRGVLLTSAVLAAVLTEKATMAAVSLALIDATVKGALRFAAGRSVAGVVSAQAVQLARGILNAMVLTKLKIATVFLTALALLGLGTLTRPAAAQKPMAAPAQSAKSDAKRATPEKKPADKKDPSPAEAKDKMIVTGRVVAPDGKPVAGARVVVLGRHGMRMSIWENYAYLKQDLLGETQTDGEGRFRLAVARLGPVTVRQVRVIAAAAKYGLAWRSVSPDAQEAKVELCLAPEQVVRGRLLDLQGAPLAGVRVEVEYLTRKKQGKEPADNLALSANTFVSAPKAVTTDSKGRFTLPGLGGGVMAHLQVRGERAVKQDLAVDTANKEQAENVKVVLAPAQIIEGRILAEDTRKPIGNIPVEVNAWSVNEELGDYRGRDWGESKGRADGQGRFKISFIPGNRVGIRVRAPAGGPHLSVFKNLNWPKGVVKQQVEILLPRGRLVRGKIAEAASGKPVAGAYVEFYIPRDRDARSKNIIGGWNARVVSGPDGAYRIAVPPGSSRLVVRGPTPDYIPQVVGSAELELGKPGGDPTYFAAVVPLNFQAEEKDKEVPIKIRRGVTIRGRLVGPDGKPVLRVAVFCGAHPLPYEKALTGQDITDGRFELRGCDPGRTYRLVFLQQDRPLRIAMMAEAIGSNGRLWLPQLVGGKDRLGAVVELSAKKASETAVVKLAPCGAVKVRAVDAKGQPVQTIPTLQLVVSPGPSFNNALQRGALAGEVVTVNISIGGPDEMPLGTDKEGQITFQGLIPGATYRLIGPKREPVKDFKVEAGKTLDVGNVLMK